MIDLSLPPLYLVQPSEAEMQMAYETVVKYGSMEDLRRSNSYGEFVQLYPNIPLQVVTLTHYNYLKSSVFIKGVDFALIDEIQSILKRTHCGNQVVHELSPDTIHKLKRIGYLQDGLVLDDVICILIDDCKWEPIKRGSKVLFRDKGVEYKVRENYFVFVPTAVLGQYPISEWRIINGELYLSYGHTYKEVMRNGKY